MSKYNKALPKPSDICFMNASRGARATSVTMPFGGTIPTGSSYVGWRQPSFTYSYQPQYYVKARLVPDKQLATGSSYSKTAWKWVNADWKTDPAKPDTKNGGVTMDKNNRWYRYLNFAGKSLMTKGSYDLMEIYVRVRTYNSKAKQHGAWVTQKIAVKCRPTVKVHKIVALASGGLRVYLNTGGWKRGGSKLVMQDIRHEGAAKKQNKSSITAEVDAIGGEEATSYPYVEISGSLLNTDFLPGEKIVFKSCAFRTCDGVDASIDGTYTIDAVSAHIDEPNVDIARDEDTGTVTVKLTKGDAADDWDEAGAMTAVEVRGETVKFNPVYTSGTDDAARTYKFMPPLDSPIRLTLMVTNDLGGLWSRTYELDPIPSNGRVMVNYTDGTDKQPKNGMFYGSKVAAMNYDVETSTDAAREADVELPHGRKRPVAFLAEGLKKTISVKGSIGALLDGSLETVPFSGYYDWLDFQEQQGLVLLRMPDTDTYQCVCTKATISQEDEYDETKAVDLSFEEVDV